MTDWMHIGPSLRVQNLCLYDKLNLPLTREDTIFASCPYAGSIAIAVPTPIPNQSTIFIYAQNGTQLSSISASAVHSLFWSNCQKLLLVNPNGRVLVYDSLGKLLTTFSMGDETLTHGLADIKVFYYANETGLAAINSARHIFTSNSVNSPLIWRLQENSRDSLHSLSAWTVLASSVKPTQILLCSRTRFLLGQQETGSFQACAFPWARRDGQYVEMEPNKTHSQLLLLHNSNLVQIIDIEEELQTELQQIKLEQVGIEQLLWCGDLAFGLKYQSELTIYSIGNNDQPVNNKEEMGANFTFSFQPPFKCVTDLETIRVFGRHFVNLVLPLAQPSKAVLGLASSEPGALLYGAAVKLEQHSYVAYEFIRSININDMPIAVEQCLAAAAHHFDPKTQKQLLKAASMGMRRCDRPFDSDKFVRISRILRVLNALRLLGFPLTFTQLEELSPPSVIDRLVSLGHWPMAVQFCDFLALDTREGVYKVLAHWCQAMMAAHKQRADGRVEELTQRLVARLKQYPAISYADIAEMASRQELSSLANTLLDMETNISRQVTVMLKFKQLEKALQTAAQSQQPDLMHLVLRHLRNNSSGREVETMLRKVPQALNIYLSEIRDEAPDRLLALYNQNDDFIRQTILYLHKAEQSQDVFDSSRTTEQLAKAEKSLRSVRESASAQLVAESAQLVADNMKREEKYGTSMSHMSVRETFFWAAAHEELALMEQLKKQFRLGEKQVFFWTVEGYARGQKWQQLEQFGRSRKSPMGYLSIIDLCAVHGNKNVATKFMDRLAGYEEQVQAYLAIGEVKKAATLAAEKSDLHTLQLMKRRFPPSSPQWVEVSKIMETLAKPK